MSTDAASNDLFILFERVNDVPDIVESKTLEGKQRC